MTDEELAVIVDELIESAGADLVLRVPLPPQKGMSGSCAHERDFAREIRAYASSPPEWDPVEPCMLVLDDPPCPWKMTLRGMLSYLDGEEDGE